MHELRDIHLGVYTTLAVILALVIFSSHSAFGRACRHNTSEFRCVEFVKNYDGDTITVNIPKIHSFFAKKFPIRVYGIDTPERKTQDPCEKEKAREAQVVTHDLLSKSNNIELRNIQRGKYFRIVAEVYYDGVSLAETLLERGLAVEYFGETKPYVDWCR